MRAHFGGKAAVLLAVLVSSGGCDDEGSGTVDGGTGGTGGTGTGGSGGTGTGGTGGGAGGAGGSTGGTGGGGSGGRAGDAGRDAVSPDAPSPAPDGGPTPDGPAPSSGLPEDILRTCRMNTACKYGLSDLTIFLDFCVDRLIQARLNPSNIYPLAESRLQIERLARCASTSTDCAGYISCATLGVPACPNTTAASQGCQGNVAYECPNGSRNAPPKVTDCAALGRSCEAGKCVVAASAAACDPTAQMRRCDGGSLVACTGRAGGGGGESTEECPAGATCVSVGPSAGCVASTAPCSASTLTCDGTRAAGCLGGLGTSYDCGAVGLTCLQASVDFTKCEASTPECTWQNTSSSNTTCDAAGDVVGCVRGLTVRLTCADFGAAACAEIPGFGARCGL